MKACENEKQDVMNRFYGIESNKHKPMIVDDTVIDCVMQRYSDKGYIVVTINRTDMSQDTVENKVKEIIKLLKTTGYYYLPVYSNYEEVENEDGDYEPSFVIFNHNYYTDILTEDFENLNELGRTIASDYHLDYFKSKRPDQPAVYFDKEGNLVNAPEDEATFECVNPFPCTLIERRRRGRAEIMLF